MNMQRAQNNALHYVCEQVLALKTEHPLRIGINGVDGSGKTMFAGRLADELRHKTDQPIITASIDGFHNPRAVRYAEGRNSPKGFYQDSFNISALLTNLLLPLGPNGNREYRKELFDVRTDEPIISSPELAVPEAILILEGIFLFRTEVQPHLDLKVFLDVPFEISGARMLARDMESGLFSEADGKQLLEDRYIAGQRLYFDDVHPREIADIVIDNADYNNPRIIS